MSLDLSCDDASLRDYWAQVDRLTDVPDRVGVLACAVRFLLMLDAAGLPLPPCKDAVMREVRRYMDGAESR